MNRILARLGLYGTIAAAFIGCGGAAVESVADRSERKKTEWRQQRIHAEERFAEVAQRLSPSQREGLHKELRREFDDGDRELESEALR